MAGAVYHLKTTTITMSPENPMKSMNSHQIAGRSLGLVFSLILAGSAYAGPGLQYWQALGKPVAQPVALTTQEPSATKVCADSELVAVTVMQPIQRNGRGPLQEVQIGTKRECHSCATTTTVMKPSGHNARGSLLPVEIANSQHACETACAQATHT